jgi:uncharacterized surface protein with fasciclin (FAS1) repeats
MEKGAAGVVVAIVVLILIALGGYYYVSQKGSNNGETATTTEETATTTPEGTATTTVEKNILETAVATPNLSTLVAALQAAGLTGAISGTSTVTVFAPTDEAFAKISKKDLDALLANKTKLAKVLTYHVVSGAQMESDIVAAKTVKTLQGGTVAVKTSSTTVMVNNATITTADIKASNGVIHLIDTVLMPK